MEIKDSDIVFVTTTLYTKWQEYSAKQVKKHFPGSQHIYVDGRSGWFDVWFEWINRIENCSEKYFIHLDEDCFLISREEVIKVIVKMESENSVLAGIPDAHFYWRNYNSFCLNPFFMIGKREPVVEACKLPYRHLKFNTEYSERIKIPFPVEKYVVSEFEPFYCFFYNLLRYRYKFTYLFPYDDFSFANGNGKLPSTNVRLESNSPDICIHMWYTRYWYNEDNIERYTKIENFLNG